MSLLFALRCLRPVLCGLLVTCSLSLTAALSADEPAPGESLLREYFRLRTEQIERDCLADVQAAEDWTAQRDARHLELREMLGLSPWPERTPLAPVVTGTLERNGIVVEKLHFQSQPGLYVTGNLYRPKEVTGPLPTVLYVCGHANIKENGVPMGNKVGYQHHGAWFAQNGYVCLTIDTIQLGEISGIHHGTHHLGMWWWAHRGYTPAGVEAWNGMRAIDYLLTRPEVDPQRIGVTGRSGGGAYSWYIAALDDRIRAAAPVAGITNMRNHIVGRCVNGHCDCMFQVNRFAWDYPLLAALVAPRPLLIVNTDRDPIFPLDGVVDVHVRVRRIYQLLNADDKTGLHLAMGGHNDIQHLQNGVFQWFNLHLKNDKAPIQSVAEKLFTPRELKVFETLPADERVTTVQDWFNRPSPRGADAPPRQYTPSRIGLRTVEELQPRVLKTTVRDQRELTEIEFQSEAPYQLPMLMLSAVQAPKDRPITFHLLTPEEADRTFALLRTCFDINTPDSEVENLFQSDNLKTGRHVYFAPRGVGKTRWNEDPVKATHTRRSFHLLGTTEDERRAIDTANALAVIHSRWIEGNGSVQVTASGHPAFWGLSAALLTPQPTQFCLNELNMTPEQGPWVLRFEQETTLPELIRQAAASGHTIQQIVPADSVQQ